MLTSVLLSSLSIAAWYSQHLCLSPFPIRINSTKQTQIQQKLFNLGFKVSSYTNKIVSFNVFIAFSNP